MKIFLASLAVAFALMAAAKPVCIGETCYPSEEAALAAGVPREQLHPAPDAGVRRFAVGYMKPKEFIGFLRNDASASAASRFDGRSVPVVLLLVLLGGLAANLTPCVLPLVPVSLALVGRGWRRGAAYGLGIATAYGVLGVLAAFGGVAFGTIQGSPWFSLAVAAVFAVLGCAMAGFFFVDLAKYRSGAAKGGPFLLGAGAAVLAGACVEPILLATLLLTAKWYAAGRAWAVVLPFVLGLGMAVPWPFAAAGMSVLPRPGAWMKWVNRVFALMMFSFCAWYGWQGVSGLVSAKDGGNVLAPGGEAAADASRPTLLILGASWCRNCTAMEKTTLVDSDVRRELARFNVRHLSLENFNDDFRKHPELEGLPIPGVPAYVVIDGGRSGRLAIDGKEGD